MPVSLRCFGNALRSPNSVAASDPSPAQNAGATPPPDSVLSPACMRPDADESHHTHERSDLANHDRDDNCDGYDSCDEHCGCKGDYGRNKREGRGSHDGRTGYHNRHGGEHDNQHNSERASATRRWVR